THDQVEAMTMGDRIAVMRDGILQQIGTPPKLYDHPSNLFVAAFIGSPAMNFASGKAADGEIVFGASRLPLSRLSDSVAKRAVGKDVLVGFRPENLRLTNGADDDDAAVRIPARVDVVEYLGHEELLHADASANEIVALVPSDRKVQP